MSNHPIEGLMNSAMENLKSMIDVNTIIGDPVETPDGSVIMTVSKVGFGYAAGGSDYQLSGGSSQGVGEEKRHPFGGGSAAGVSITPIAFLIVNSQGVKMLHLNESTHLIEKILESAPVAMDKVESMISKASKNKKNNSNQVSSDSSDDSNNSYM